MIRIVELCLMLFIALLLLIMYSFYFTVNVMSVCVGDLDKTNHQKVIHCDDIYVFSYLKVQSAILILHTFCQIQQRSLCLLCVH